MFTFFISSNVSYSTKDLKGWHPLFCRVNVKNVISVKPSHKEDKCV